MHSFVVYCVLGTKDTAKMTDIVCLHRVELMARGEVILRQLFVSVIYLSFSYMVDIVDWTCRHV